MGSCLLYVLAGLLMSVSNYNDVQNVYNSTEGFAIVNGCYTQSQLDLVTSGSAELARLESDTQDIVNNFILDDSRCDSAIENDLGKVMLIDNIGLYAEVLSKICTANETDQKFIKTGIMFGPSLNSNYGGSDPTSIHFVDHICYTLLPFSALCSGNTVLTTLCQDNAGIWGSGGGGGGTVK